MKVKVYSLRGGDFGIAVRVEHLVTERDMASLLAESVAGTHPTGPLPRMSVAEAGRRIRDVLYSYGNAPDVSVNLDLVSARRAGQIAEWADETIRRHYGDAFDTAARLTGDAEKETTP